MNPRYWMFHPDNAPNGRLFDRNSVSQEHLADQGWVDSPAKFGHSVTGQGDVAALARAKSDFESGVTAAVDAPPDLAKERRLQAELADLKARMADRERTIEGMRQQLDFASTVEQGEEKKLDDRSDGVKDGGKPHPAAVVQVTTPKAKVEPKQDASVLDSEL